MKSIKKFLALIFVCSLAHADSGLSNSKYLEQCKTKGAKHYGEIIPSSFTIETNGQITGTVVMSFTIEKTGFVSDVRVVSSEPKWVFDRAAVRAMRNVECKPVIVEGKAVKVVSQLIEIHFEYPKRS